MARSYAPTKAINRAARGRASGHPAPLRIGNSNLSWHAQSYSYHSHLSLDVRRGVSSYGTPHYVPDTKQQTLISRIICVGSVVSVQRIFALIEETHHAQAPGFETHHRRSTPGASYPSRSRTNRRRSGAARSRPRDSRLPGPGVEYPQVALCLDRLERNSRPCI